ncbi:MAG TPA: fibronectin type III domain-containing protein [Chthoniobacterales bacterium]|nr:fibronectin type III domain-containing protein [Chthoniobacterales bacterium]
MNIATSRVFRASHFVFLLLFLLGTDLRAASLTLYWDANSEPDLAGYRVHYGTAKYPYGSLVDIATTSATITNLKKGVTYTFAVTAYNTSGAESDYSAPISYTVGSPKVIPTAVLANISSRTFVQTGEDVMIGGFIVDGIVGKKVAVRAIGPSLTAAGVAGALGDPVLQIVDNTGAVVTSNDNWNVPGEELTSYGLAPADGREAGLVATLAPGAYSAVVSGQGNASGVALVELYDLDAETGRVANISTRSRVESGDNVMIGGFILGGSGTPVIVRAIGPSLAAVGIANALLDPRLELYDVNGTLLASNDNWRDEQEGEIVESGLMPSDDREAALLTTLSSGAYSAVISGATGGTGVALFEVYALNQ